MQIVPIDPKECGNGQQPDALVPITIWAVFHEPKAVRGCQGCEGGFLGVVPLLLWACQGRFEDVFVPDSRQPAVFPKLIVLLEDGLIARPQMGFSVAGEHVGTLVQQFRELLKL